MTLVQIVGDLYVRTVLQQQQIQQLQGEQQQLTDAFMRLQSEDTAARIAEVIAAKTQRDDETSNQFVARVLHEELNKPVASSSVKLTVDGADIDPNAQAGDDVKKFISDLESGATA